MLKLIIGNKNYSSWSLRPWLFLRQFELPFEELKIPLDTPEFRSTILDYSPSKRVPALHDEALIVWDSLAICEHVNEHYLNDAGWPKAKKLRALARSAVCEMHSGFGALRTQLPMNCRRTPKVRHWDAAAQQDIDRVLAIWQQLLTESKSDKFLCGEFGIVDAMFAPVAVRFRGYGVDVDARAKAYMNSIFNLPSYKAWQAEAELETERLAYEDI